MMKLRRSFLAPLLLGAAAAAGAGRQDIAPIEKAIGELVAKQTAGLPGKVSFTVGAVDPRLNLPACGAPEAFLPVGTRLWGNATVGVRCTGPDPWIIYVPVKIKVVTAVVMAARPLAQGKTIELEDILLQQADLTLLPASALTDARQALGRLLTLGVAPGQPLRHDLLRSAPVIQQGQTVVLRSQGAGFRVSAEGKALNNAADGGVAQVRTASGQTVSGIARPGSIVEVTY